MMLSQWIGAQRFAQPTSSVRLSELQPSRGQISYLEFVLLGLEYTVFSTQYLVDGGKLGDLGP
ncbi:hypothetical protein D3C81_2332560 [compost metagenome]